MLGRSRVLLSSSSSSQWKNSLTHSNLLRFSTSLDPPKKKSFGRRIVPILLFSVTGGLALSALDDLHIYSCCSGAAIEKARQNKAIVDALGEPIVRGPWYNASLAVAHKRNSVSCTFPVAGTQGTAIFQLKAIRQDDSCFSLFRSQNWEILVMEALIHVPGNEEKKQKFRIALFDQHYQSPALPECTDCKFQVSQSQEQAKT